MNKNQEIIDLDDYLENPNIINSESKKGSKKAQKEPIYERNTDTFIAPELRVRKSKRQKVEETLCPDCLGSGFLKVVAFIIRGDKKSEPMESKIKCSLCAGTGKISVQMKLFIDNLWCNCAKANLEDAGAYFVSDGIDKNCQKHHWKCKRCDKIKQIG